MHWSAAVGGSVPQGTDVSFIYATIWIIGTVVDGLESP